MIGYWHHAVVCPSVYPSVCDTVLNMVFGVGVVNWNLSRHVPNSYSLPQTLWL